MSRIRKITTEHVTEHIGERIYQVSAETEITVFPFEDYGLRVILKGPTEDIELDGLIYFKAHAPVEEPP